MYVSFKNKYLKVFHGSLNFQMYPILYPVLYPENRYLTPSKNKTAGSMPRCKFQKPVSFVIGVFKFGDFTVKAVKNRFVLIAM